MAERFSSRSMLRLAVMCVAFLGLGLGAACDSEVRAQGTDTKSNPAPQDSMRIDKQAPSGGGPIERGLDRHDGWLIDLPFEAPKQPPSAEPNGGEQPQLEQQGQQGPIDNQNRAVDPNKDDDEASGPNNEGSGGEEAPEEENWGAPVRGSGGNNPPDFIAPSDPKAV